MANTYKYGPTSEFWLDWAIICRGVRAGIRKLGRDIPLTTNTENLIAAKRTAKYAARRKQNKESV